MKTVPRWLRRRTPALAFALVVAICAGSLIAYAVSQVGNPVHHAELNDGGVWVSNNSAGYLGRMNKPVSQLDGGLYSPGGESGGFNTDLVQSGSSLIAWDKAGGKLIPVDTDSLKIHSNDAAHIADGAQVVLGGDVLAVLNPASGQLWATEVAGQVGSLGGVDATAAPLEKKLGANAVMTVGADGTIFAESASQGLTTIRHTAAGFAKPEVSALTPAPTGAVSITAVGDKPVLLGGNTVFVPGSGTAKVAGTGASLQQPGPATADALVATSEGLYAVPMNHPAADKVAGVPATGAPANPVQLGGCRFAAWAGSPGQLVTQCGSGSPTQSAIGKPTQNLVFRVNRNQLLLNDTVSGAVFNVDSGTPHQIDNWSSVIQTTKPDQNSQHTNQDQAGAMKPQPPKAKPDTLGARPGRTTALYVLDNDSDPTGNILSIQGVTGLSDPKATLSIAPDGQTVDITLPTDAQGSVTFNYVVGDGTNPTATAQVVVNVVSPDQLAAPTVRTGYTDRTWHVPAGGQILLPVLADWRNYPNGDVPVLRGVSGLAEADGTAATSADGHLLYNAPATAGPRTLTYTVGDGSGPTSTRKLSIVVQGPTESTSYPATAEPDYAHGQVGSPILVQPLANDLPGSDPHNPNATLALAGKLASPAGTTVTTDLATGTVSVIAKRPGNFSLTYQAAYGNARYATGKIRINAVAAGDTSRPITSPVSAVLYGQQPATVDVLAADYDPSGRLLAVQNASGGSQFQVAVLNGRWLRINALSPNLTPRTRVINYTVTNGVSGPVTGQVIVNQLPLPADSSPVTAPDFATVRAGDSVTIPVLDNDIDPTGAELSLRPSVGGGVRSGALSVTPAKGMAFVSGNVVRYVAPPAVEVTQPTEVTIDYIAQDADGHAARGQATVTVNPPPSQSNPDQAPDPQPVEARVVAGDTSIIQIPVSEVDPDGDTVTVTGIGSPPSLGRIMAVGATSITYQAYPAATNGGTDTISYVVDDGHGQTATSTIRIAVVPPGLPQPPVAEDIALSTAPDSRVSVDVLAHVLRAADDKITISPLGPLNPGSMPGGARLLGSQGPITLTANGLTGKPVVLRYQVSNGTGSSVGTITVRSEAGAVLPPVVHDQYAKPAAANSDTVDVNVLKNAYDPTGGTLRVTYPAGVTGSTVMVKTSKQPQVVPYVVTSSSGATATAIIFVPPVGAGTPRVKPDVKPIQLAVNATKTIDINDYAEDPAVGKKLRLTTRDQAWASPDGSVRVKVTGTTTLAVTTSNGYQGPGAITFQVTDGTSVADPNGQVAILSVPAQIGSPTPVLRCPADAISLVEGGQPVVVDVGSVCHVWTPDPSQLASLQYTASWKKDPGSVSVQGGAQVSLTAEGAAKPGSTGTLSVGVKGSSAASSSLAVLVTQAPAPTVAPITVDGIKAGESKSIDVSGYVTSALRDPKISVVGVPTRVAGDPADITASGSTIRLTPGQDSHGSIVFSFVISDVADTSRGDRHAVGQIRLNVLGHPAAPGAPVPGRTVQSKSVLLSWSAPADNGAPITYYQVDYGSGQQRCAASPCNVTGLKNGQYYSFSVTAYNLVGASPASPRSVPARPDQVPSAVTNFVSSNFQDHTLQLTWTAAQVDGTPVSHYSISWGNGGSATVGPVTSYQVTGLNNDTAYTFTIQAQNDQGFGAKASTPGQSAGAPLANPPAAPRFSATTDADGKSRDVQVSWDAEDPNGKGPATYTLTRTDDKGGSVVVGCADRTATSCADSGLKNDGTIYTYSVVAANFAAIAAPANHTTQPSPGAKMEATATPDAIVINSVAPTGADGALQVNFDAPASHGKSSTISCTANGAPCGSWSSDFPVDGQSGVSRTITGLANGQSTTITLQDCNGSQNNSDAYSGQPCDAPQSGPPATPYGPIRTPTISVTPSGTAITWNAGVDPNGRPVTLTVSSDRKGVIWSGTTGTGSFGYSGQVDEGGYSITDTFHVTATDTGSPARPAQSASASATTPAPPPQVIVSKGASCYGSSCSTAHPSACKSSACAFIHVQTKDFSGGVTCTFNSSNGSAGFVNENYGANESKDSYDYFGYPGGWVEVTCGGVASGHFTW